MRPGARRTVVAGVMLGVALLGSEAVPVATAGPSIRADGRCAVSDLPGLAALFSRARRRSHSPGAGLDAEPAADYWRVVRAVVGPDADAVAAAPAGPDGAPPPVPVPCGAAVQTRDGVAWRLALGGYSAREAGDVLAGHLTPSDLDEARMRLMAGAPDTDVAAFLEARWREAPLPALPQAGPPERGARRVARRPVATGERRAAAVFDGEDLNQEVERLAGLHDVPAALIRAVIAAESAGDAGAVSPAGAIGLMQLMPGTARALGVDPWVPRDNLRGGVIYLGRLLRRFDDNPRLALIAYNAGPGHADDVQAGRAVPYRETRDYLAAIDARYPLAGRRVGD